MSLSAQWQSSAWPKVRLQAALVRSSHQLRPALARIGAPSVLCGDYNVVPTQIDVVVPRRWLGVSVYFPECRQAYAKGGRRAGSMPSGASIRRRASTPIGISPTGLLGRLRSEFGLRMDHLLVSPSLSDRLRSAGVDVDMRGWEKPSDHAPAWIKLY
ncbi:endonuclease/exonuclease/phosphatase family protein [Mesorhizobium sp. M0106]|uniref:endonuclease/exonuclease/phosphatase family protein n=1 Tax=Mesorhizobium sp. M0106 TaxID=2956880 RepID=UPI00333C6C50